MDGGEAAAPQWFADRKRLIDGALAVNLRYLVEVVEAGDFCPFARGAREAGRVTRRVYCEDFEADERAAVREEFLSEVAEIAGDRHQEIALMIFPRVRAAPALWHRFAAAMRKGVDDRLGRSVLAVAAFHPKLEWDASTAVGMMPLFRRSPDPTLQWVRMDVLDAVSRAGGRSDDRAPELEHVKALAFPTGREPRPSVSDRITRDNHRRTQAVGVERVARVVEAIISERDRKYAGIPGTGTWATNPVAGPASSG